MNKNDFKYGCEELYITDKYVLKTNDYILLINEKIFDDETIEYAERITKKYVEEKNSILNFMLDEDLRDFYSAKNYSDEDIKNKIGIPNILISSKKDDQHPDWNFTYAGSLKYCESSLDEHIIIVEFIDDLKLIDVMIDG